MHANKKKYVLVGTGGRAVLYTDALSSSHKQHASLEGICDLSQTRMDWHNLRLRELHNAALVTTYRAAEFDRMVRERRPDVVIVTTMDSAHHEYIVRAMELGCDVISEKPMTTDATKARAIFDAIARTGRSLRVTFNVRYMPMVTKVRELMMQGVVGKPRAVTLNWMLDSRHGADYFHRWHREKDKSGGLLVHKATHHFDMINWWIDSYPRTVFAMGDLLFYGRKNAEARGERYSYDRYTGIPQARRDPFGIDLSEVGKHEELSVPTLRGLYLNAEKETGYIRDRNVFGDGISVEDTVSLAVRYRNGVIMNYSLVAYSPWEGYQASITGDKGRIDIFQSLPSPIIGTDELPEEAGEARQSIRVHPMFSHPYDVQVPAGEGSHGGGDKVLLDDLFCGNGRTPDPFGRAASHIDGAASMLIGISANESIRTGLPVNCRDLLDLPDR